MVKINLASLEQISMDKLIQKKEIQANEIAIIGIAGQFPKAEDIDAFWENLKEGLTCVQAFPEQRREDADKYVSNFVPKLFGKGYGIGSYLEDIDTFDYSFFKLSPSEANLMDPSQRLFLQTAYHAIEDAGYAGELIRGSHTGVYLGYNADALYAYRDIVKDAKEESLAMAVPGNLTSIIASRIAYLLDFKGPSLSVDTACSSSLVAVHLACQAIRSGDCHMALAGSVRLNLLPVKHDQKLGIESSDGITRTFDESSDGTGNGEGVCVLMLKGLSDALKDKDHIYGVIKGSAMNQDGSSVGITAPNVKAQEEVILKAWEHANIDPRTISYIEAHGTGTRLGDPIEIDALTRAFRKYTEDKHFCAIGSVKTNMGHLDNAAGMAGMAKATLALKAAVIPPHLHFKTPNAQIDFDNAPVYVETRLTKWEPQDMPRRCGVSAFGLSGTNCHIVMEEAPYVESRQESGKVSMVPLSAKSKEALQHLVEAYQNFAFDEGCILSDIAYTASLGREHHKYRLGIVATDVAMLQEKLRSLTAPYSTDEVNGIFYGEVGQGTTEVQSGVVAEMTSSLRAAHYVSGQALGWQPDTGEDVRKTRIPCYPFEKKRCWVELPEIRKGEDQAEEASARTQVKEAQQSQGFTVKPLGKEDEDYTLLERHLTQIYGEVLGFEEINIEDDFFDLGGDSIIAMKIAKIIQDRLGIQAHMADLLECIGIAEYSAYLLENADCSKLMAKETEVPQEEASDEQVEIRCYPASSAQKRLFVTCQDEALSVTYNITNAIEIQGAMEVAKITEVFNGLTKRHESLRTSFEIQDGEIMQIIHPTATFEVEHEVCAPTEVDEKIRSFVKGFDLTTYPLMRVKLLQLQEDKWILVFDASHLICDGYSVHLISSEFIRLYAGDKLGKLGVQYHDYTSDQEAFKQEEAYKGHQDYWQRKLGGDLQKLELPNDFQEITNQSKKGAIYRFTIPEAMMAKVNAFASEQGTTLYMVLLAVYKVMLSKYCQQEDIVVGTPIAGRNQGKFDGVVGMFVNTLAIRSLVTPDKCVSAFLSEVKQTMLEAYKHEAFQFEDVVACVDAHTRYDENPLFNTMFALQNLGGSGIELQGMSFTPYPIQQETSRFELMFNAIPKKQGLEVEVEYRTGRFKEVTIKAMGDHFINLLNACIADASRTLGSISMVSPEALAQVHWEGWLHEKAYPLHKNLVQLIDEQVKKQPTALAVISGSERLTYEALDTCANQVAKYLQMQGVAKGDIVGIAQERSSGCIVSILGILKIGAVYLPIDTTYPQERVDYMLKDSGAKVLLTPACLQEALQVTLEDVCTYEDVASTDPAYVIYTSGSTGTPKGVVVSHRSVVNFIYSLKDQYEENVGKDDKFLALTNLCFDVSVSEIFTALCFGAELHFYQTGDFLDLQSIAQYMTEEGITYTYLPPAYLETMCELLASQEKKVQLNKMLVGVEPIKDHVLDGYLALNPKMCIVNGYGPTEATICASFYVYKPSGQRERIVPIGKALANTNLYILDKSLQPVPQGVQGEICISGEGLALGYLGKPELSSEKFITNPFASGQRLYRTGDMGKFLEDGNVQFMGRQDHQVKIRGYRIELGEVEAKLSEVQGVKHAVVLDQVDAADVKYLCAYVVLSEAVELKTLRQQLKAKLPSYMIPSHFVLLETLPVTSNGKIDRKALVALGEGVQIEKNYVEPQTTTEKQLAALWEEVLETKPIGREDDFFELGGHSIKATRLAHQMKDTFNVQVPIRTIFDYPSVQQMADWLEKQEQVVVSEEQGVEEKELYQASTDQERMYIVQTLEPESTAYNMPVAFEVQGALDFGRVKEAFRYMINRHEALRTSFHRVDDVLMQKIHPISEVDLPISQIKCTQDQVTQVLKQFIQPFNLTDAPLLRVNVIALASEHFILALDMHHIISDGRTIEILAEEFTRLYSGEQLEPTVTQYKVFSEHQRLNLTSKQLEDEKAYWQKVFEEDVPVITLPYDYERPAYKQYEGASCSFALEKSTVEALERLATETGTTLYMVLLACYNLMLSLYSGQQDIVVGTPVSARDREALNQVAGLFVNTLPLRTKLPEGLTYGALLRQVKQVVIEALDHQHLPLEALNELVVKERDLSRSPLFDTLFLYQAFDLENKGVGQLSFKPLHPEVETSKVDVTLNVTKVGHELQGSLEYATSLFKEKTVKRMLESFLAIIQEATHKGKDEVIDKMALLPKEDRGYYLTDQWVNEKAYPKQQTLVDLFKEQVQRVPHHLAVVSGDKGLTYEALDKLSDTIAYALLEKGCGSGDIIALGLERGCEVIACLLGVSKAGCAYVPIDLAYPMERIAYILEDSQVKIILVQEETKQLFEGYPSMLVDALLDSPLEGQVPLVSRARPEDHVYTIYTSGSTGNPKGVVAEQRNVMSYITDFERRYGGITEDDRILGTTNLCFDVSVCEVYGALCFGAELHMLKRSDVLDIVGLANYILEKQMTYMYIAPGMLKEMSILLKQADKPLYVNKMLVGVEPIKDNVLKAYKELNPQMILLNAYGPTETTVFATYHAYEPSGDGDGIVPIGKMLDNGWLYILDKELNPVPHGVQGEICLSGPGVTRGYYKKEALTAEKFVENPFVQGQRLYRTGDLGKIQEDGTVYFMGRRDHQVKIRGHRIELGEVEAKVSEVEGVDKVIALAKEDNNGQRNLWAYVVGDKDLSLAIMRDTLKDKVPEYMVPAYFIILDTFPLTPNGKVNRKALMAMEDVEVAVKAYEAPQGEKEVLLQQLWGEVLRCSNVSVTEAFEYLGGDSIKAIQLVSKAAQKGYVVTVRDIIIHNTIRELAKHMTPVVRSYSQEPIQGEVGMIPVQTCFFEFDYKEMHIWNVSKMFYVKGSVDPEVVRMILTAVVTQHDALRGVVSEKEGERSFYIRPTSEPLFDLTVYDLTDVEDPRDAIESRANEVQASIDLEKGPFVKVGLFKTKTYDYILLTVHHLAMDYTSALVVQEDIMTAYGQLANGQPIKLKPKTATFKDWSASIYQYAQSPQIQEEKDYWYAIDQAVVKPLPKDHTGVSRLGTKLTTRSIALSEEETKKAIEEGYRKYGAKAEALILGALGEAFKRWCGHTAIRLRLAGNGKDWSYEEMDTSRTVGWFSISYPLLIESLHDSPQHNLESTLHRLQHVPTNGSGYDVLRYITLPKDQEATPLTCDVELFVNYVGDVDGEKQEDIQQYEAFGMSDMPMGVAYGDKSDAVYTFDFSIFITGGKLHVAVKYLETEYEAETVDRLLQLFSEQMSYYVSEEEGIECCTL